MTSPISVHAKVFVGVRGIMKKLASSLYLLLASLAVISCSTINGLSDTQDHNLVDKEQTVNGQASDYQATVTPFSGSTSSSTLITIEPVSIRLESRQLVLTNNTSEPILYEAFAQEILALIEWAPCDNPDECPEKVVSPGETVRIGLRTVTNRDTKTLVVFWWNVTPTVEGPGFSVTNINMVEIELLN
jgi:hypothetical protein